MAVLLSPLFLQPAFGETLREAVERTLRTNPDVQIEVARRYAVDEAINQASAGFRPKVDLAVGQGTQMADNSTTRSAYGGVAKQRRYDSSLTISQMLFDGFGTSSEVDRARARVESSAHKVAGTSEQIALRAIEAYLEVLRQTEVTELTRENLNMHLKTYDQIKLRAASGVGRKSDLDQIEARVALARSNLTSSEANLVVAKVNYKLIVGSEPDTLSRPSPPGEELIPKTPDEAVLAAILKSRLLRSAEADVEAAKAQHESAKAALQPRADLEIGLQRNNLVTGLDRAPDNNDYAMVRMRFNLYRGGADTARVTETLHNISEARQILERAKRQLEQSTRVSWNAYQSAVSKMPDLIKHAEASMLTREAYLKQFALGQRTLLDLLDTENEYLTAGTNLISGQFVELFSRYRVLADLGKLVETLELEHLDAAKTSAASSTIDHAAIEKQARDKKRTDTMDEVYLASSHPPIVVATPPPQPVTIMPPSPANEPQAATPSALVLSVGKNLPPASAERLATRLETLGFPVAQTPNPAKEEQPAQVIIVGPYSSASKIAKDIARLDDLGLEAKMPTSGSGTAAATTASPAEASPAPIAAVPRKLLATLSDIHIEVGRPVPGAVAARIYARLESLGYPIPPGRKEAPPDGGIVILGPYSDNDLAAAHIASLRELGLEAQLQRREPRISKE